MRSSTGCASTKSNDTLPTPSNGVRCAGFVNKLVLGCFVIALIVSGTGGPAASLAAEEKEDTQPSIAEQRRAAMRGGDPNRPKVEVRKSSPADIAKGDITFDDLQFDIEKGQPFKPEQLNKVIQSLNGKDVKLRGYILPSTVLKEKNIDQFVLVRDNQECCFGPGAALFDCVMVVMKPGKSTDFATRPVEVRGKFVIDVNSYRYPGGKGPDGGSHFAVFRIEGEAVR